MNQENDSEALKDFKKILQDYKSTNIPESNWRLHALLRRLGLTKYEAQAYIMLVECGCEASVTQIVKKTGIPHPRAYDTLSNLVKYGLITPKTQMTGQTLETEKEEVQKRTVKTYRAFTPTIGIGNLFAFFKYARDEAIEELNALAEGVTEFESGIWEIHGQDNIVSTIKLMIQEAKHEILISTTVPFIQMLKQTFIDLSKRKVQISCVTNIEEETDIDFILEGLSFIRIRKRMNFPMPYIVIDRNRAIQWNFKAFKSGDPQFAQAQVISKTDLIDTIIDHFFFLNWRLGKPMHTFQKTPLPCTFIHSVNFVEEIEKLLGENQKPQIVTKGKLVHTGEHTLQIGKVTKVYKNWESGVFTVFIQTDAGERSIGGFGAIYEDIAADQVTISLS